MISGHLFFELVEVLKMKHQCKITVLETKVFPELQEQYLADPKSGPCPCFKAGDTFLLKRTPEQDDFYHLMNGKFCGEAYRIVSFASLTSSGALRVTMNWMPITGMNMLNMVPPIRGQSFFREMASLVSRQDSSRKIQSML